MSKKVVDLVVGEDGSYVPKVEHVKSNHGNKGGIVRASKTDKPKYFLGNDADEFLAGIDVGLDLVESVGARVSRFLKLRG